MTVCVIVGTEVNLLKLRKFTSMCHEKMKRKRRKQMQKCQKRQVLCKSVTEPWLRSDCVQLFSIVFPHQRVKARISRHVLPPLFSKLCAYVYHTMRALKCNRIIHLSKGSSHKSGSVSLFSAGKKNKQLLLGVARVIGPERDFLLSQFSVLGC